MSNQPENKPGPPAGSISFCGLLGWLIAFVLLAIFAFFHLSPRSAQMVRLWLPVVVETNGNQTILGETRQMEFWTPSVRTKDYLHKAGDQIDHNEKWQVLSSDDAVTQFGMVLHSNQNVLGYRRVEVWGQGRTSFKPGWWWTMNVLTNYSVVDLAHVYREYWKSPQPMLVEVVDNRGSADK